MPTSHRNDRALDRHAVPQRGRDARGLHRQGAVATSSAAASPARSIIADNGSTDGSQEIARDARRPRRRRAGARATAARSWAASRRRAASYVIMGDADDSYDFSKLDAVRRAAARGRRPRDGQPLQGRHRRRRDAAAAPVPRQPGAVAGSAGCSSARRSATSTAGCAASTASRSSNLAPADHGHGVRERDGRQGDARRAAASPRCRRRSHRTAAAGRRTCAAGATAGATCGSSCSSARAGCS